MLVVLDHPEQFKTGIRLLYRTARNKDGAEWRQDKVLISYDEYDETVSKLLADLRDGERIYASVDERNFRAAQRVFNEMLVDANFSDNAAHSLSFYRHINARWNSALGQKSSALSRLYLFDLDGTLEDITRDKYYILKVCPDNAYAYQTKNGLHIISEPFDPRKLPQFVEERNMRHTNALMLVAYWK